MHEIAALKWLIKNPRTLVGYAKASSRLKASLSDLTGVSPSLIEKYLFEVKGINNYVKKQVRSKKHCSPDPISLVGSFKFKIAYVVCRAIKPDVVVETGAKDGISTTYILQALRGNHKGKLYSIDLRDNTLEKLKIETGWLIPSYLRDRWTLIEGKSSEKLIPLLNELNKIDIFHHDSDHSYSNMKFEYETAWKYLQSNGILLSDDIKLNAAWKDFTKDKDAFNFFVYGACLKSAHACS